MAGLHTRTARLALLVAATLLGIVGLALVSSLMGCGQQVEVPSNNGTSPSWDQGQRASKAAAQSRPGSLALASARVMAAGGPARGADSWGEIRAREFIWSTLQQYDYEPTLQEFIGGSGEDRVHSANVVAVKEGQSARRLIIGAHYDASGGQGYVDNAVGVGLLLELAARLNARPTPYTLVFVALGAEEPGLFGSKYYVRTMTDQDRESVVGMIDLDAVAGGDSLYVLTEPGAQTWLRDDVLAAAQDMKIALQPAPQEPGPLAIGSSHAAFDASGMTVAVLTAGHWTGDATEGNAQTEERGVISGTRKDTVRFVEEAYPGRVRSQLHELSRLLEVLLTSKLETHS